MEGQLCPLPIIRGYANEVAFLTFWHPSADSFWEQRGVKKNYAGLRERGRKNSWTPTTFGRPLKVGNPATAASVGVLWPPLHQWHSLWPEIPAISRAKAQPAQESHFRKGKGQAGQGQGQERLQQSPWYLKKSAEKYTYSKKLYL